MSKVYTLLYAKSEKDMNYDNSAYGGIIKNTGEDKSLFSLR
jgi:hypothetical protein